MASKLQKRNPVSEKTISERLAENQRRWTKADHKYFFELVQRLGKPEGREIKKTPAPMFKDDRPKLPKQKNKIDHNVSLSTGCL